MTIHADTEANRITLAADRGGAELHFDPSQAVPVALAILEAAREFEAFAASPHEWEEARRRQAEELAAGLHVRFSP